MDKKEYEIALYLIDTELITKSVEVIKTMQLEYMQNIDVMIKLIDVFNTYQNLSKFCEMMLGFNNKTTNFEETINECFKNVDMKLIEEKVKTIHKLFEKN
ncbi:MAG: hypothetical protein EOM50_07070 [Erysipelotrichia bacterium]|nr:hypothetical protein [Erysipelotrichia bacterium]NCC55022.1 hypothetical protein [Erysipelotrichia bacterium]